MTFYRSPYEAYPFLSDADDDLRCDFELVTDELASGAGLLRSQVTNQNLAEELLWICELIYHINPTLRTSLTVTKEETARLAAMVDRLQGEYGARFRIALRMSKRLHGSSFTGKGEMSGETFVQISAART